jgi:uncharacterized protein YdeI (YjbR/CyaY-like superfamily)
MKTAKGVEVPADVAGALRADAEVHAIFEAMRPSCQKEYVAWVEEAKRPETRARRVEKLAERVLEYGERHPEKRAPRKPE